MEKIRKNYDDIAPILATGTYSRTIRAGDMLFISGLTAARSDAENGDFVSQTREILDRLSRIMQAEGGSAADVVRVTVYVTDIQEYRQNVAEYAALMKQYFQGSYPTAILLASPALSEPSMKIEFYVTAIF